MVEDPIRKLAAERRRTPVAMIADDLPPEEPGASADGDDWPPAGGGICWSWGFDFEALLDAVSGPAPWLRSADSGAAEVPEADSGGAEADSGGAEGPDPDPDPVVAVGCSADPEAAEAASLDALLEAEQEAYLEAVAAGAPKLPLELVAGRVAENLPT